LVVSMPRKDPEAKPPVAALRLVKRVPTSLVVNSPVPPTLRCG
jgi:hypothetical protein